MNPTISHTNWLPGIVVLVGGLIVAALYLLTARGKGKAPAAPRGEGLDDLERRAQSLIDQLKELNADRHHLTDEQFTAEKTRLEQEAAGALRARDEFAQGGRPSRESPSRKPEVASGFFARHPELKGALWGGGVVLFFVALGLLITQNQRARGENDSVTGTRPDEAAGIKRGEAAPPNASQSEQDAQFEAAVIDVKAHPEKVDEATAVAHELIAMRRFDEAGPITERTLGFDPYNVEARVHRAGLLAARGEVDKAKTQLSHLADSYPDATEALLFMGMIGMQEKNHPLALYSFERYAAEAPKDELPPQLFPTIAMLREAVKAPPTP